MNIHIEQFLGWVELKNAYNFSSHIFRYETATQVVYLPAS